jgi:formylglycine-generating enzyme required for sulfatase activity
MIELLSSGLRPCVPAVVNSLGMRLNLVPAGSFWMGSPASEDRRADDEGPRHLVTISRPFYAAAFQVTQEQYEKVMGHNPSWFSAGNGGEGRVQGVRTNNFPVEYITHEEAEAFCERLSELRAERGSARTYRLLTEAEWEYACRGAGVSTTPFHFGRSATPSEANFDGNYSYGEKKRLKYRQRPVPVGSFAPNVLGLFDMHGNVWEWCSDWYDPDYYERSQEVDPPGPEQGSDHVLRGGSWIDCGYNCRSAFRDRTWAGARVQSAMGIRVAMNWRPAFEDKG